MNAINSFWSSKCPALVKTGFKVFSEEQLTFLASLADTEYPSKASEFFRGICGRNEKVRQSYLGNLIFKWHLAASWVYLELDVNHCSHRSHLRIGEDISLWGDLWEGIERLETWFQVKEGSAIWSHELESDEDENEDECSSPVLLPITLCLLESFNVSQRREFIEKLEKETFFDLNWREILNILPDEFNLLKYGETGFRLNVMLEAEKGNSDAIAAWQSIKN
jgi:hypothetical protein